MSYFDYPHDDEYYDRKDRENDNYEYIYPNHRGDILNITSPDSIPDSVKKMSRNSFMDLVNAKILSKEKMTSDEDYVAKKIKHIIALAFCYKNHDSAAKKAIVSDRRFILSDLSQSTIDLYFAFAEKNQSADPLIRNMIFTKEQGKGVVENFPSVIDVLDPRSRVAKILIEQSPSNNIDFGDNRKCKFLKAAKRLIGGRDCVRGREEKYLEYIKQAIKDNNFLELAEYIQMRDLEYFGSRQFTPRSWMTCDKIKEYLEEVKVKPIHEFSEEIHNLNILSQKETLTEEERELLEKARIVIYSNYGDPTSTDLIDDEMTKLLRFKDTSEYKKFKSEFIIKMKDKKNQIHCNDLIYGFINHQGIHNLIAYCLKMLKCKESCELVGDLLKTIPYSVLLKERAHFDDPDYEWLMAKKITASNMDEFFFEDSISGFTNNNAIFELIEYHKNSYKQRGKFYYGDCYIKLGNIIKERILSEQDSLEAVELFLASSNMHLNYLAELRAIKAMTGSLSSYSDFEKHYTPSNTTNTEHFRMLAWESFINIDCFSKSLTLDQLITFAESEVVNVRRTAEIKISELLEDELSKEDLEKIASCNNETVACVARAIIWKDNDVTIEDITSKYGGTEEENGHAALAYYLTGSSISEEALDEKGDIGHYEKITGKNGGGAALKRSKSASKYPKKK